MCRSSSSTSRPLIHLHAHERKLLNDNCDDDDDYDDIFLSRSWSVCHFTKKLRIPIYIQCNKIVFKTQQSSVMMIMIISLTMLLKKSRTAEMVILTFLSWKITSNIWSLHGGLHLLYQPLRNDDAAFFVINITIVLRKRGPSTERDHQLPHRLQNLVKYD